MIPYDNWDKNFHLHLNEMEGRETMNGPHGRQKNRYKTYNIVLQGSEKKTIHLYLHFYYIHDLETKIISKIIIVGIIAISLTT